MKRRGIKIAVAAALVLFLLAAVVLGSIKLYRVKEARQSGILLAFDDYSPENWSQHFDLFEKYGVHVTFFIAWDQPTDFCHEAIKRGHDIGFHSIGHVDVTSLSEEEIMEYVIEPIETFRKDGIELTSFAYPFGSRSAELDEKLLKYYKIVRGAYYDEIYSKADLRHGFVDAFPIDNINLRDDKVFQAKIDQLLNELSNNIGAVYCLYSHTIEAGDWCVTAEHLEYLFQKADELGLKFYTYRELQKD